MALKWLNSIELAGKMLTQVLVLIDRLSKWTKLVPLRSATAESLRKAFRGRIIARYARYHPKVVKTSNGVHFASRIFKSFLAEMGIRQQFTAPYTPQENQTERANRTVKTLIAQFTGQDQINWIEKWPENMLAVNPGISESSLYDRETLGTGRATETPEENAKKLREVFEIVRRNLEKAFQDQARHYNLGGGNGRQRWGRSMCQGTPPVQSGRSIRCKNSPEVRWYL